MQEAPHQIPFRPGGLHGHGIRLAIDHDLQGPLPGKAIVDLRDFPPLLAKSRESLLGRHHHLQVRFSASEGSAGENAAAQAPAPLEEGVGPGGHGLVHPVTGFALLHPLKDRFPDGERFPDQGIEIDAGDQHVATQRGIVRTGHPQGTAQVIDDFPRQKSDLRFGSRVLAVVPVPRDSQAGLADSLPNPLHSMFPPPKSVPPLEIMSGRNPDIVDLDLHDFARGPWDGAAPQEHPSTHSLFPFA